RGVERSRNVRHRGRRGDPRRRVRRPAPGGARYRVVPQLLPATAYGRPVEPEGLKEVRLPRECASRGGSVPPMSLPEETSLQTRRSLLSRLRDYEDKESWQTFFDRYWRLLYNVA